MNSGSWKCIFFEFDVDYLKDSFLESWILNDDNFQNYGIRENFVYCDLRM